MLRLFGNSSLRDLSFVLVSQCISKGILWCGRATRLVSLNLYDSACFLFVMGLQAVYKKLMMEDLSLKDLQDLQPQLARGFEQLLEFEGDVADTFCQTFQVTHGSNCLCFLQGVK